VQSVQQSTFTGQNAGDFKVGPSLRGYGGREWVVKKVGSAKRLVAAVQDEEEEVESD
jgi:hypothetical protein